MKNRYERAPRMMSYLLLKVRCESIQNFANPIEPMLPIRGVFDFI